MHKPVCFLAQTACKSSKIDIAVRGRLVATYRTNFQCDIFRWEARGSFEKRAWCFFVGKNLTFFGFIGDSSPLPNT